MNTKHRTRKKENLENFEEGFPDLILGISDAHSNGTDTNLENFQPQPQGIFGALWQAFKRARTGPRKRPEE